MISGYYGDLADPDRSFDLYPPAKRTSDLAPLLIHVHGGAWRFGDKSSLRFSENGQHKIRERFQAAGFAVASINYRLTGRARFPEPLHDLKQAIRHFRGHATDYGIDPRSIALSGASAGGHLVQLAAATGDSGQTYLEGPGDSSASSMVNCAVSFYGVSDLRTIFDDRVACGLPFHHPDDDGAERRLLGSTFPPPSDTAAEIAWSRAHPVDYARSATLSPSHRPVFYLHGDADGCVPWNQSTTPHAALRSRGISTALEIVPEADHSDATIYGDAARLARVLSWVERQLSGPSPS
ncbi:alpha/beta hydrolase [Kocuria massiliensis]|uniref:alpha/beta hydrolase n=1 Tax=Kocuria massiliensis TaxID=1926282 RepID=UPI000A1C8820|nr:alpha/beta hydrolase [Kocuria massiliensis]